MVGFLQTNPEQLFGIKGFIMTIPTRIHRLPVNIAITTCLVCLMSVSAIADDKKDLHHYSRGQIIYAPVYSHIYIGNRERPFLLAVTLSIRNTDPVNPIMVQKIAYYNSEGKLLKEYLKQPVTVKGLSATRFVVDESDKAGGSGASFIVEWEAEKPVSPPIIETVMIGAQTQQGISFSSRGQVIKEK